MVRRLASCLIALAACDRVYGLERPAPPADAAIDAAACTVANPHDEDADGRADCEDNCPGVANGDQANVHDADPVGDVCDPDPFTAAHSIVNVDTFIEPDTTLVWRGAGAWQIADDVLVYAPAAQTRVAMQNVQETIEPDTSFEVGFVVTALPGALMPPSPFGAIEVFPAAGGVPASRLEPFCSLAWDPTMLYRVVAFEREGMINGAAAPFALRTDTPYRLTLRYAPNRLTCTLYEVDSTASYTSVVDFANAAPSGLFTIQSHSFALRVNYVIRYVRA